MNLQLFAEETEETRKAALYDAFAPSLETLAKKYGIEADPAALETALTQEAEAEQQYRQRQADSLYQSWMEQAEQTRQDYPDFDMAAQMQDPRFVGLLQAQVDVRTAYEALHREKTLERMEKTLLDKFSATGLRPQENGTAAQSSAVTRQDVSRMSKSDRQAIIRRVQQGEKITF